MHTSLECVDGHGEDYELEVHGVAVRSRLGDDVDGVVHSARTTERSGLSGLVGAPVESCQSVEECSNHDGGADQEHFGERLDKEVLKHVRTWNKFCVLTTGVNK